MDETLKQYLQRVENETAKYKSGELKTKEYLQSAEDIKEWLKERCNENSRN